MLYDFIQAYWPPAEDQFAAVWAEGLSVTETARRIGADLDTATVTSLRGIGKGLAAGPPDPEAGVVLVGECGTWTLTVQVQGTHILTDPVMSALSADGRAVSLGWHVNGGHHVTYAAGGAVIDSRSMNSYDPDWVPEALAADDLTMPVVDEDEDEDDVPIEEMITVTLALIGRLVGQEIDEDWLEDEHTRFVVPAGRR
ncbi:hypothetical protein GCM10009677_63600 [Sphaerisporangium rubeum]|uniref:Uncharacterized protein n=1 Tax=Sphaerisporangium rubeum TaxID=321317 RepID=A0A7X0IHK8_9ACTN|nr:DUF6461 domain-containing protein [Sphaerisporangium rubeum]MBB6474804.1 hypothetical protein [Sphaerisporangium rubeum]